MEQVSKPGKIVLGLIEKDGNFLLIRRRVPSLHVEWAFPGGKIKEGETEEKALVREIREEVGLDVEVVRQLLERKHPNTLVQTVYFHCRSLSDEEPKTEEEYEIAEIEWVRAEEVLKRFTSDVHPIIREFVLSFAKGKEKERVASRKER